MFLAENSRSRWRSTFLCLRRGVSDQMTRNRKRATFSLPTQRCFRISRPTAPVGGLFSAYAEVFLREAHRRERESSFLCLRRGVSNRTARFFIFWYFSLPTQRCFRVIAQGANAGNAFLCLRRGVSWARVYRDRPNRFSLPTQRCFYTDLVVAVGMNLFSAYAEVFLGNVSATKASRTFLCLRRGVSQIYERSK